MPESPEREREKHPFGNKGPRTKIDWDRVDELIEAGCTKDQIAPFFGISTSCFTEHMHLVKGETFSSYCQKIRSRGDALLLEAQFKKAIGKTKLGDTQLLQFLGKVRLNQIEVQGLQIDGQTISSFDQVMQHFKQAQQTQSSRGEARNDEKPPDA